MADFLHLYQNNPERRLTRSLNSAPLGSRVSSNEPSNETHSNLLAPTREVLEEDAEAGQGEQEEDDDHQKMMLWEKHTILNKIQQKKLAVALSESSSAATRAVSAASPNPRTAQM